MTIAWTLALLISAQTPAQNQNLEPPLVFHASFDGTLDAAAAGEGRPVKVEGPVAFRPGRFGQALLCGEGGAAVTYAAAGHLKAFAGTVEMWVCPLDWTGAEDEFHVFLEALDPGRLVFYRYYQGGITTLLGSQGGDYRAATSPRIHWSVGQWHHLAGTWRGSELAVYVDGQRMASAQKPPVPDRLATTFRVGDGPWHVKRHRQTLIDELKLYSAPLDAASIARAARGEPVRFQPKMLVDVAAAAATGRLGVACDVAGLIRQTSGSARARVELAPKGSRAPARQAVIDAFPSGLGHCEFSVRDLPEGDYDVRAVLLDPAGKPLAEETALFHMPGPPIWSGNNLGLDDKLLPPWTPLRAAADGAAIECWGRRYQFGTLLDRAQSSGAELLSSPVTLEAVVAGKAVALAGPPCHIDRTTETRAALSGRAESSGLRVAVRHELEFDGQAWTDLVVHPTQPVRLDELRLTWSMPKAQARLLHADAHKWIDNPAGALQAEGWSSKLVPFFWLGNEDHGLCWYTESDRDWQPANDRPAIQVTPAGDAVRITVRLIAAPRTLSADLTYGFGMMATPVRLRPADARAWRMAPGDRPTFEILWPNTWLKWYGHPEPKDAGALAAHVRAAHKLGRQVVPYVNLNFVSAGVPEWQYYGSGWADPAHVVTPSDVAAMGHPSMGVCPAVRDWQDFILLRISEMIDRFEIDGIYIDCWSPYPCKAGPCTCRTRTADSIRPGQSAPIGRFCGASTHFFTPGGRIRC